MIVTKCDESTDSKKYRVDVIGRAPELQLQRFREGSLEEISSILRHKR